MQFSEQWLRTMVDPQLDSAALGHLMTMAGLEVEEAVPAGTAFSGVVVAEIVSAEKHPNADKLKVCQVNAGGGELLQIVCGAPNAAVGLKVPLAKVGASLPGFEIKAAKLRGVESFGMLCSARELGLSDDHAGLLALPESAVVGTDVRELLELDDTLFTIKLTPNRADCLSVSGVAREVAALTGAPLNLPAITPVAAAIADQREIVLEAPEACPRYCGRIIRGVNARAQSPEWMQRRLVRSGIRSISALVDITNYVMLELGQPLHVFDNDKLTGSIRVRKAAADEQLLLLNEQQIKIVPDTLVIADEQGPLALAGIMGGEHSGVTLNTQNVFLESAFFAPESIAGRARIYGFSSDASHRYERGVDFELAQRAAERATQLILEICGGAAGPLVEACAPDSLPARPAVTLRPARARKILGVSLSDAEMAALLQRLQLQVETDEQGNLRVTPPSFRFDIQIEEDLIEEVVRLHGYEQIPMVPPTGRLAMLEKSDGPRSVWAVRERMMARGYQEVINYAFVEEAWEKDFCAVSEPVRLANPIASHLSVMRSSLIAGLVGSMVLNRKRQLVRGRFFEIGRCFEKVAEASDAPVPGFHQPVRLAALAYGSVWEEQWGEKTRTVDFYDLKRDLETLFAPVELSFEVCAHPALHPGRSAAILRDGVRVGVMGELHPQWVQKYDLATTPVVFEIELDAAMAAVVPQYREVSRFPVVSRDLALIVDQSVTSAELLAALRRDSAAIVQSVELFDMYQGKGVPEGKKSLAFRVLMQDTQRTLEDQEVDAAVSAMVAQAEQAVGAKLRA
jgi:phenylalanyl-tRNA synthetase beta chain